MARNLFYDAAMICHSHQTRELLDSQERGNESWEHDYPMQSSLISSARSAGPLLNPLDIVHRWHGYCQFGAIWDRSDSLTLSLIVRAAHPGPKFEELGRESWKHFTRSASTGCEQSGQDLSPRHDLEIIVSPQTSFFSLSGKWSVVRKVIDSFCPGTQVLG